MDKQFYIKFLILLFSACSVIVYAEPITFKPPVNSLGCASTIPCPNATVSNNTTIATIPTTPSTSPTSPKPICPNCPNPDCSTVANGTTFPYANHCRLFYMCIAGNAEVCTCPSGEWYDRMLTKCAKCELVINCIANID